MITTIVNSDAYEYRGLSTDTKPDICPNGSIFIEMNTGKIYFYNLDGKAWVEWSN